MTLLTAAILSGAAFVFGLACGGWGRRPGQGRQPQVQAAEVVPVTGVEPARPHSRDCVDVSCLWDPHSCFNALSRCIASASQPLAEDHQLYTVSDHLRLLAQLSHSGGWVSPAGLREWLLALMALQPAEKVSSSPSHGKAWNISLPDTAVRKLQLQPLGRALLPLLRQAGPGADVSIEPGELRFEEAAQEMASLVLRLRVIEGRNAAPHSLDGPAPALREWNVQVVCECLATPVDSAGALQRTTTH